MKSRKSFYPAALSCLLPGLGQLYLGQYVRAIVLYVLFIGGELVPSARIALPVLALLAGLDALWITPEGREENTRKQRVWVYFVVGMTGFLMWMGLFAGSWHPAAARGEVNHQIEKLVRKVKDCRDRFGAYPKQIVGCGFVENGDWEKDPWGNDYEYAFDGNRFELRSRGPDGIASTEDDLVYTFR